MKSNISNVATFLAMALLAGETYSDDEKEILGEIAEALGVDKAELIAKVDEAVTTLEEKDDETVQAYLEENVSKIEEEDASTLMQCAIEIVLADGVVTCDEVQVLFDLADATGVVEYTDVVLMLIDLVKYDSDIVVVE
jgi:uncharacterized tellurite resistance protein B-like protein